jgi:N-formylglutamate amidohydrolase
MDVYHLTQGQSPLIISNPHSGTFVPDDIKARFTAEALALPDTDWHIDKLYQSITKDLDATMITANYSRYVIDLNRPPDNAALYPGQTKIPLCPDQTFNSHDIYQNGLQPDEAEIAERLALYWRPYHDALTQQIARVKSQHGYAILYDAHSICQGLTLLFDGDLPDLNIGTAQGKSCSPAIEQAAHAAAEVSPYSNVLNGRFIGGYITRHHGDPANNVHALQMELIRALYMDEETTLYNEVKATQLITTLSRILTAVTDNAESRV